MNRACGVSLLLYTLLLQGGFALRRFTTLCSPLACVSEKSLQLSQKSLLGMGRTRYDPQESQHTICMYHNTSYQIGVVYHCCCIDQDSTEQIIRVLAAKNFSALQTASGKVRNCFQCLYIVTNYCFR